MSDFFSFDIVSIFDLSGNSQHFVSNVLCSDGRPGLNLLCTRRWRFTFEPRHLWSRNSIFLKVRYSQTMLFYFASYSKIITNFWKNLDKIWIKLEKTIYPDFILILSRFFSNSLYPNFILILSGSNLDKIKIKSR